MTKELRILLLEDRPADAELVMRELRKEGVQFVAKCVTTETAFLAQLRDAPPDLILADYSLPAYDGLSALAATQKERPETPFIFVSGTMGEETAIEALHHGATDYVLKHRLIRLGPAVQRALRELEARTQRRQAQEALRASERSYREIFDATHDAIFVHDAATGAILDVNQTTLDMFGYSREELLNLPGDQFRAGAASSHQEAVQRMRQAAAEGPQVFEWQSKRKNGELFWTEVALRGAIIGGQERVLAVVRDITARKQLEQALRESGQFNQQIVASAQEGIIVYDRDLKYQVWNPFMEQLTGLPASHVLGKHPAQVWPHVQETGILTSVKRALAGEPTRSIDFHLDIPQTGKSGWAFQTDAPLRNPAGDIIGVIGIVRDITERKRAEEAQARLTQQLESRERRLTAFFSGATAGLVLVDKDLRFVQINDTLAEINGLPAREHLGRTLPEVLPKLAPVIEPLFRKVLATGKPLLNIEVTGETPARPGIQRHWMASYFPVIGREGTPEGVGGIVVEVTERKALEQQLRQAQKMEAIGQLAGGVAHDFNNMLAVIRGNAELLLMDPDQHTPETKDCLKQIAAASERAANLTRQLLAFSRKQVMQSQPLVLNDVIADLTKMLKRIIGEHIDLQCRYAAQLPFVQADAGMIEQALVNLAVNARDAMPHGGQLLITTGRASFDGAYARTHPEARAGEFVCLAVADAGIGIAPEHLPRIFEPFFTTKGPGKGTGLGLATVYGIVKQHQGWIEVSSQPGAGATFKIFLPTIPAPARAAASPQAEADLPGGTETILLVEDDYSVRMITRRVLESHGYKIYEATTAREALDLWRSRAEEIALLLTDIVMPEGVTGRDLAEQLRAQRPALKVVFMSGYSADVVGKDTDFFRRTRSHFLQKPCPSRTLLETVRHCLDAA